MKTLPITKKDLFNIDIRLIDIDPTYNTRTDYGADFTELTESIYIQGVQVPMMVRSNKDKPGRYLLVRGHRRYKAMMDLYKAKRISGELMRVPCQKEAQTVNEVDRLIDQITSNTGKPLTALETAEVIKRLFAFNLTDKEIAKKLAKSTTFVNNMAKLSSLPADIKTLIQKGTLTSTLVMEVCRSEKSIEAAATKLKAATPHQTAEGKTKITKKDVQKAAGTFNSYSYLKKTLRKNDKAEQPKLIRPDKKELYEFITALMAGELSPAALEELFFDRGEIVFDASNPSILGGGATQVADGEETDEIQQKDTYTVSSFEEPNTTTFQVHSIDDNHEMD